MEQLIEKLSKQFPGVDFINGKSLVEDGEIDSFDIIEIMSLIEENYSIEIDAEEIDPDNFQSAEAMWAMIESKIKQYNKRIGVHTMKILYPNGKVKALTFSYDDGQIHDIRLAQILRDHGMKCTFNLNSGTLADNDNDMFVNKNKLEEIYAGHEIAIHGVQHKNLLFLSDAEIITELMNDRIAFETMLGHPVQGMAYAFGAYDNRVKKFVKAAGVKYSRTVGENHWFDPPTDFLEWNSTCHHNNDLMDWGKQFLNVPDYKYLPVMYVWGHSFELAGDNTWGLIEEFATMMEGKEDIWYATNGEICDYITAVRRLEYSADGTMVKNPTDVTVWYCDNKKNVKTIAPGELHRF